MDVITRDRKLKILGSHFFLFEVTVAGTITGTNYFFKTITVTVTLLLFPKQL